MKIKPMIILLMIVLTSCSKETLDESFKQTIASAEKSLKLDSLSLDTIIPIKESPYKKFLEKPKTIVPLADNPSTIYDIAGFPINIIAKESSTGQRFLTSQGVGNVLVLQGENANDLNQRFSLQIMPLTGYVLIKNVENKLVSAGTYASQPDNHVLYVKDETSTLGASWSFLPGQITPSSYIFQNADVLGFDGPEPTPINVYNKVIGTDGNNIYFDKYRNQARQEFEVRLIDDFVIDEIQYINDATATLNQVPDFTVNWTYTNGTSVQQSITTNFGQKASKTSNFNTQNTFTTKVNTEIKVGVPFFANGKISTEISGSTQHTYGTSETTEDTRDYNIPILVPANTRVVATASVTRYDMNVKYIATLRGLNTNKIIKVAGVWNGVDCTDINITTQETNLLTNEVKTKKAIKVIPN
ncbi:ETX/MTX2 family pore-forming toxin [Olivibacter domesticus]|uniref:Toxin ETX/toxin MTX2 n=1 Tax=Olivibacter domesticus TaxID=407022 RepID=A0A1H7KRM2_OLID1|nr:ETX/MTX2 family pore-forming toxin [Olivibacter domesticus]SEK88577.1 toxin ETX/toxin MTX2 [Olivibacter domesticus]